MLNKKLAAAILAALMFNPVILPPNNFLPAPVVCAAEKSDKYWADKGDKFWNSQEYEDAVECYSKAVEINQKNDSAWNHLGAAYYSGNYQKALECFNKALELNPDKENYKKWRENALAKMN